MNGEVDVCKGWESRRGALRAEGWRERPPAGEEGRRREAAGASPGGDLPPSGPAGRSRPRESARASPLAGGEWIFELGNDCRRSWIPGLEEMRCRSGRAESQENQES